MADDADILNSIAKLPSNERAAALSHWVYVQTSRQDKSKWPLRVAASWSDLAADAKQFNVFAIDTWAEHPDILDAWVAAVKAHRQDRASKR